MNALAILIAALLAMVVIDLVEQHARRNDLQDRIQRRRCPADNNHGSN